MPTEKAIATLTVHGASKMTESRRKDIAIWLRMQAADLLRDGDQYTDKRFTARYFTS